MTAVAKGFGSENCGAPRMFIPATSLDEIKDFIVSTVLHAGGKSCPPVIVGVGIGGTMDKAAALAKQATFRGVDGRNANAQYAEMELELLERSIREGLPLPFPLQDQTIFYLVPAETKPGNVIGSAGPTSSYRMDPSTPLLLEHGMPAMIGKGPRSAEVVEAVKQHGAVFCRSRRNSGTAE